MAATATQEMAVREIDNSNNRTDDTNPENTVDENNQQQEEQKSKPGHTADPSLNLEGPTIFNIPNSVEEQSETKFFNKDVKIRLTRWAFLAFMPCIFLIILTAQRNNKDEERTIYEIVVEDDGEIRFLERKDRIALSFLIGIGITVMYLIYFGLIGVLFYTGSRLKKDRSLFRIWTKAEAVPGWASMSIAVNQQLYHFEAIQSISEFSAIDGGIPSFMLSNLGPFTWAVVAMHFASELHCNSVFEWDIADYFEIIGIAGLVMIGIFELDPYNPPMKKFHYLGAAAGVGTILGYVIQGWSLMHAKKKAVGYLIFPLIIGTIAITCFVLWQLSNRRTDREQERIREKYNKESGTKPTKDEMQEIKALITKLSLTNVITEGIFLFCGAFSLALWLMFYEEECCCGCAGPGEDLACSGVCY